jgi:ATP-dependent helicase HepA
MQRFLSNQHQTFLSELRARFEEAQHVYLAVCYVHPAGWSRIAPAITTFLARPATQLHMIFGWNASGGTSIDALHTVFQLCREHTGRTSCVLLPAPHGGSFHAKLYVFRGTQDWVISGSANLTASALSSHHEASIVCVDSQVAGDAMQFWHRCAANARQLTPALLKDLERREQLYRERNIQMEEELPLFVEGNLVTVDTHPAWGIGTVQSIAGDDVHVRFYRGANIQTCSVGTLVRHRYEKDALIFSRTEQSYGNVQSLRETDGLITYQVQFGQRRKRIPEIDIVPVPPASDPFDLLREGQTHDAASFLLAFQARRLQYAYSYDDLVSLSNARIDLLPHQVFVAHRVLSNYPHRFLLADEVGLGKTIEAGLVIKELRARDAEKRVLIIAPSGLVPQWVDELKKKFNERFTRIDSATIGAHIAMHGEDQVWKAYSSIVTSLHLLRNNDAYVEALAQQEWDLIVFDEAHHLRRHLGGGGDEDRRSITLAYHMAERLQQSTTSLLLLTATPLQIDPYELFSLVELLDPTLFPTYHDFEKYRGRIPLLNGIVHRLDTFDTLDGQQRRQLADHIVGALRAEQPERNLDPAVLLQQLNESSTERSRYQEEISSIHRLTSVMLRNRKRLVFDDLKPRQARILTVQFTAAERAAYDAVTKYIEEVYNLAMANKNQALGFVMVTFRKILTSSSYALRQSFGRRITRLRELGKVVDLQQRRNIGDSLDEDEEAELDDLLDQHSAAVLENISPDGLEFEIKRLRELCELLDRIEIDTKAARLRQELETLLAEPQAKVLIFTQFKETLNYLQGLLSPTYRIVVFHGGMDTTEKDAAVDTFHKPDGAQIMIGTEAAGEGRNLQFCHVMFNYDLPWNPMRIEQRIGRIDRIGQQHPVEIYNFTIADTVEARVLEVLHLRIRIFESAVGNLDPILEDFSRDMLDLLINTDGATEAALKAFEDRTIKRIQEARKMEERLSSDFILDTRSFRRDRADALLGRKPAFTGTDLQHFMAQFLHHANGQMRERADKVFEITIPRKMREGTKRELKDSYTVTFDSREAQKQERLDFVAFGHELLDRAVEVCLDDAFGGKIAQLRLESDQVEAGPAICAIYEFSFHGIRPRKQLWVVAVALNGDHLPALSERFSAIIPQASDFVFEEHVHQAFQQAIDDASESIEELCARELERERLHRDDQNVQDYQLEHQKLTRFYVAKIESAQRAVNRLQITLREQEQQKSRIVPATRQRLVNAERHVEELGSERDQRLSVLDQQQRVAYSSQLLSVACVLVQSPQISE